MGKKEQKERTQVPAKKNQKPKVGHKGAKEQIMFQSPTIHHIGKRKGWEVLTPYIPATPPLHLSLTLLVP